jgi:hypothetical protein
MELMLLIDKVLKFVKFTNLNDSHPPNIKLIFITLVASIFDKSNEVKERQSKNSFSILMTEEKSKSVKSKEGSEAQPLNILSILPSIMLPLDNFIDVKDLQS